MQFFNRAFGAHHNRTAAGIISRFCTAVAQNHTAGRKVRTRHDGDKVVNTDVRIVDVSAAGGNDFAEVVRRNVGGHTDGNTVGAVNQQVRITRGQNRRFLNGFVIVRHKIDGFLVDIFNQRVSHLFQTGFGITHGRGRVTVHRTEVALSVYQRQTHGERLRHTNHGIVNRAVAVRVVFTEHIADDTGGFAIRTVIVITVFIHGINNAAVYRFQAVADIRQRARNDDAHGIVEVRAAHFLGNRNRRNVFAVFLYRHNLIV